MKIIDRGRRCRAAAAVVVALALIGSAAAWNGARHTPPAPTRGPIAATAPTVLDPAPESFDPFAGFVRARRSARGPGYTLLDPRVAGETPAGFAVWLSAHAPHRAAIAAAARSAVRDLHALGLVIRWRGYGTPPANEGAIRISESRRGCRPGTSVVGITWPHWQPLGSGQRYMTHADIALCPSLFSRYHGRFTRTTVRHELGHAVGLAHTNYRYRGSYQVMNAAARPGVVRYRAGDRRGLRLLASRSHTLRAVVPPTGKLTSSKWQPDNRIVFTGWAALRFYPSSPVTLQLLDNGRAVAHVTTRNSRARSFRLSTPWPGGSHRYCVRATSTVRHAAARQLGCVTWHS